LGLSNVRISGARVAAVRACWVVLGAALLPALALAGCADPRAAVPPGAPVPAIARPGPEDGVFTMDDGAKLPYRAWLPLDMPADGPWAVILALHGMNDSRDAWEIPAPAFAEDGIAVFSPDQRGFGDAPDRGHFAGADRMAEDAATMARDLRRRYPHARLILMGESMGAAVLMRMAALPGAPKADGMVLVSPAVWDRSEMNVFMRVGLWFMAGAFPGLTTTGSIAHVTASDNRAALMRLYEDGLTIHATRFDAIRGLVDLMDEAQTSAHALPVPVLLLYGGKDELIPPRATAATWRAVPKGAREAFYPGGYHLLMRDRDRAAVIGDVESWITDAQAPLPSGADRRASTWLAGQP
jgi:alpha-beta hydrolase superfamily lysophospholipase